MPRRWVLYAVCLVCLGGCRSWPEAPVPAAPPRHEKLDAVLWMQTSAEYEASARQAYHWAAVQLDEALRPENGSWTADPEQTDGYAGLPLAVVLDVDDAVLSSIPFQARIVKQYGQFQLDRWRAWMQQGNAPAVPGAVEFAQKADARGVRLLYLTNRDHVAEAATLKNLRELGFPVDPDGGNLLTRGEQEGWSSKKIARRAFVRARYRVVLVVGDDLNDFVAGSRSSREERDALSRRYADYWGTKWILLPNPVYGDWERALHDFERGLSRDEVLRRKNRALDAAD